jgi:cell division transport system permease protein
MTKLNSVFKNLRRSPYQSLAAFIMTSITFFVVSIFTLLVFGTERLLTYFESRPQVTAFFEDKVTDQQVQELRSQIEGTGFAQGIKYVSKAEALEIYKSQNEDNPLLLEMVTADILPASLEVSSYSVQDLGKLAEIMKKSEGVEEVVYQEDVITTLTKWVNGVRIGGLAITSLLLLGSLVTIVVILGMRVAIRKNEIKTLYLLGASGWYIRSPLLFEGMIYSTVGVVFGWGATYLLVLYLTPNLLEFFSGIDLFPVPPIFMFGALAVELVGATLLAVLASLSAMRRYGK